MTQPAPQRRVRQPGPPAPLRTIAVRCRALSITETLPPGARLLDALANLLTIYGADSACLHLSGGALGPFAYVIPALSPDHAQAAFYSDTRRPSGATRLDAAAVTVGTRDNHPFFHCHAVWTTAAGAPGCGHVLPDETIIAASITVRGAALFGARFEVAPDTETGFSLFSPQPTATPPPAAGAPAIALRLAPNQDLLEALEAAASQAGFPQATLQGGVASTIGARFTDAPPVEGFATELLVRHGVVAPKASAVDIAIVDLHATIGEGRLVPGDNPVLMTFEGALVKA